MTARQNSDGTWDITINGVRAEPCDCEDRGGDSCTFYGCFIPYRCPECRAHLSTSGICLNACHLGRAGRERFIAHMAAAREGR
jgi:hypothetical protein